MTPLAAFEAVIDTSGVAPRIEAMLPIGVRLRQLTVRTLLAGMCLALADHRAAHLTRVHQALTSLPGDDQRRLGVIADWKHGPHLLTYRQTGYTFGLVADAALAGGSAKLTPAQGVSQSPQPITSPGTGSAKRSSRTHPRVLHRRLIIPRCYGKHRSPPES